MTLPKITVLGGGTGTFTILSGLKQHSIDISAIVSIADDGGSTGILRDELGVLPPGDIRQCLVALSEADDVLRRLFMYRFSDGSLAGHNFGNLFLSALEKISGNPIDAMRAVHEILNVKGQVIPASAQMSDLYAELEDGTIVEGEDAIEQPEERAPIRRCFLSPSVPANPDAIRAIQEADILVLGPGDLFTSIMPVLLVDHIADTIRTSRAQVVYIMNLMTKRAQTDNFPSSKFVETLESIIGKQRINKVIMNNSPLPSDIAERYEESGEGPVADDLFDDARVVRADLLASDPVQRVAGDTVKRSLIRHDSQKLADVVMSLF